MEEYHRRKKEKVEENPEKGEKKVEQDEEDHREDNTLKVSNKSWLVTYAVALKRGDLVVHVIQRSNRRRTILRLKLTKYVIFPLYQNTVSL